MVRWGSRLLPHMEEDFHQCSIHFKLISPLLNRTSLIRIFMRLRWAPFPWEFLKMVAKFQNKEVEIERLQRELYDAQVCVSLNSLEMENGRLL